MAEVFTACFDGKIMKYAKFGEGKKTMVILPGLSISEVTKSAEIVQNHYSIFLNEYTIYLVDQRNNAPYGYNIPDMTQDTISLFKFLGLKDIYLFGASLGGIVAMDISMKKPEFVIKLAVVSTIYKLTDKMRELLNTSHEFAVKNDRKGLCEFFSGLIYSKDTLQTYGVVFDELWKSYTDFEMEKFERLTKIPFEFDFTDSLQTIRCPVWVCGSLGDKLFSKSELEFIANSTGGELYMYGDEFGHAVFDEAPDFHIRLFEFFEK